MSKLSQKEIIKKAGLTVSAFAKVIDEHSDDFDDKSDYYAYAALVSEGLASTVIEACHHNLGTDKDELLTLFVRTVDSRLRAG